MFHLNFLFPDRLKRQSWAQLTEVRNDCTDELCITSTLLKIRTFRYFFKRSHTQCVYSMILVVWYSKLSRRSYSNILTDRLPPFLMLVEVMISRVFQSVISQLCRNFSPQFDCKFVTLIFTFIMFFLFFKYCRHFNF